MHDGIKEVSKIKQDQILKLVTNSFYKELKNYGVEASDIVTVSVNLLDHITSGNKSDDHGAEYYNDFFRINSVKDNWKKDNELSFNGITIQPVRNLHIKQIAGWLKTADIDNTIIGFMPKEEDRLRIYLMDKSDHKYFAVYHKKEHFVGIIGAENVDHEFKRLEMKKLIGEARFRGMGLGKSATFLFLYYAFNIMKFNKVYIHSMDTNIGNININSKFGFGLEGILYGEVYLNGKYRDILRMGLLRSTWDDIFS
ncbi:MAG: GNAT family protein [Calditrichaceae bacterium]|jgi:RimJ/RimL family protein N-acetyltransferase